MMGLTAKLAEVIHELRLEETNAALPSRLMAAILSTVAQLPLLLSPAAAFSVFTIVARNEGSTLDASRMFASLSLIVLLTQPLFFLFQVILDISTALGCFGRIEKFLEAQARNDTRHQKSCSRISISKHPESGGHDRPAASGGSEIELIELNKGAASTNNIPDVDFDLTVERLTLAWPDGARPIVRDLSVSVARGRLTMVVGPVASGKSTLLKGLLGEVPSTEGSVSLGRGRLAWCDQNPWLIVGGQALPLSSNQSYC